MVSAVIGFAEYGNAISLSDKDDDGYQLLCNEPH